MRARQHWRRLDDARAQQGRFDAEVVRLREELALAKQRDQRALGEALAAGHDEPEPEAAAIEKEIERNANRSSAMIGVVLQEQRAITKLVERNKDRWLGDLRQRHLPDRAAAYRLAAAELERGRAELVEQVNLGAWLAVHPATGGQVSASNLPASPDLPAHVGGPSFAEVLGALRRDVEQLPQRGPVRLSDKALRDLDRKKLVLEHTDAEGNARPQGARGRHEPGDRKAFLQSG